MEDQPEKMTLCELQCVVIPNGEVLCNGINIGWFEDLKNYLEPVKK